MALIGLPSGSSGEDIKSRIEYDAKAGKWHRVERAQNASGEWVTDKFEMDKGEMFVMDIANIEVGWIRFSSQPDFQMVPNGQQVGPKPSDVHKVGFRVPILLPRETVARNFASTAKSVIGVIDELHTKVSADAPAGHAPVVKIAGTRIIETKTPQGTNRNYAPLLEIVKYVPRPAPLGDAPSMGVTMAPSTPAPAPQPAPAVAPAKELVEDEVPF